MLPIPTTCPKVNKIRLISASIKPNREVAKYIMQIYT